MRNFVTFTAIIKRFINSSLNRFYKRLYKKRLWNFLFFNAKNLVLVAFLSVFLQSCVFVAGAAAGATTIAVVHDHRNINASIKDMRIANKILEKLRFNPDLRDESHIEVSVFNQVVLLIGETPNAEWRQEAHEIAQSVPGTKRIYNLIVIGSPTSSLTRTSDSWITAKIKTQMLTTKDLSSSNIKVVTENGVTYLMGVLSHQQGDMAVDIAKQASGVQKVVKVFQYTD